MHGYLKQAWVLEALGVPVNFTETSPAVQRAFQVTGDIGRGGSLAAVSYLLESGVKVHMMYGDRDNACNWLGGEAASLALDYSRSREFSEAGYAPIFSEKQVRGFVRQYGNYSFSRVFQSGHEVPWYAPEVAYDIFHRSLFNKDIATGLLPVTDNFSTIGPSSTFHIKNAIPPKPKPRCYIFAPGTCTSDQYKKVIDGSAKIKDNFLVEEENWGWTTHEEKVMLEEEVEL